MPKTQLNLHGHFLFSTKVLFQNHLSHHLPQTMHVSQRSLPKSDHLKTEYLDLLESILGLACYLHPDLSQLIFLPAQILKFLPLRLRRRAACPRTSSNPGGHSQKSALFPFFPTVISVTRSSKGLLYSVMRMGFRDS